MLVGIASNWKKATGLLLGLVLLAVLLPTFSASAQSATMLALVRGRGATLYDRPAGDALRTLSPGDRLDTTGRTEDAAWITGAAADGQVGWLRAEDVIIYDLLSLPVTEATEAMAAETGEEKAEVAAPSLPAAPTVNLPTPTPTPVPSPTPITPPSGGKTVTGVVRSGGAELRASPQGTVSETMTTGAGLTVVGRSADNAWLLATSLDGVTGWVERARVVVFDLPIVPVVDLPATETAAATQPTGNTTGNGPSLAASVKTGGVRLNVRSGPGTPYAIVAKLSDGAPISLLARNGDSGWVQVALDADNFGWVSARYVAADGAIDQLPVSGAISETPASTAPTASNSAPAPSSQPTQSRSTGLTGKLALAAADGTIVLYDLGSGSLRTLTAGVDPAISPDGQRVAFLGGDQGLYVIDVDGSNQRRLYSGNQLRAPAWSPDGQSIVFSRVNGQETCRDAGFRCLPDIPQYASLPLVSKDQRTISRVGLDGSDFRDIPSQKSANAPSWTAAGIVYQSSDGLQITQDGPSHDKDGNPVNRQVTDLYMHRDPSWQSDGWLIAFVDDRASHREIYTIDPNGNGMTALTRPASALMKVFPHNVAPVWSPDDQQIAFLSNRDGDWGVFVMNGDGSNQRRLDVGVEMGYRFQNEQVISWGK